MWQKAQKTIPKQLVMTINKPLAERLSYLTELENAIEETADVEEKKKLIELGLSALRILCNHFENHYKSTLNPLLEEDFSKVTLPFYERLQEQDPNYKTNNIQQINLTQTAPHRAWQITLTELTSLADYLQKNTTIIQDEEDRARLANTFVMAILNFHQSITPPGSFMNYRGAIGLNALVLAVNYLAENSLKSLLPEKTCQDLREMPLYDLKGLDFNFTFLKNARTASYLHETSFKAFKRPEILAYFLSLVSSVVLNGLKYTHPESPLGMSTKKGLSLMMLSTIMYYLIPRHPLEYPQSLTAVKKKELMTDSRHNQPKQEVDLMIDGLKLFREERSRLIKLTERAAIRELKDILNESERQVSWEQLGKALVLLEHFGKFSHTESSEKLARAQLDSVLNWVDARKQSIEPCLFVEAVVPLQQIQKLLKVPCYAEQEDRLIQLGQSILDQSLNTDSLELDTDYFKSHDKVMAHVKSEFLAAHLPSRKVQNQSDYLAYVKTDQPRKLSAVFDAHFDSLIEFILKDDHIITSERKRREYAISLVEQRLIDAKMTLKVFPTVAEVVLRNANLHSIENSAYLLRGLLDEAAITRLRNANHGDLASIDYSLNLVERYLIHLMISFYWIALSTIGFLFSSYVFISRYETDATESTNALALLGIGSTLIILSVKLSEHINITHCRKTVRHEAAFEELEWITSFRETPLPQEKPRPVKRAKIVEVTTAPSPAPAPAPAPAVPEAPKVIRRTALNAAEEKLFREKYHEIVNDLIEKNYSLTISKLELSNRLKERKQDFFDLTVDPSELKLQALQAAVQSFAKRKPNIEQPALIVLPERIPSYVKPPEPVKAPSPPPAAPVIEKGKGKATEQKLIFNNADPSLEYQAFLENKSDLITLCQEIHAFIEQSDHNRAHMANRVNLRELAIIRHGLVHLDVFYERDASLKLAFCRLILSKLNKVWPVAQDGPSTPLSLECQDEMYRLFEANHVAWSVEPSVNMQKNIAEGQRMIHARRTALDENPGLSEKAKAMIDFEIGEIYQQLRNAGYGHVDQQAEEAIKRRNHFAH